MSTYLCGDDPQIGCMYSIRVMAISLLLELKDAVVCSPPSYWLCLFRTLLSY